MNARSAARRASYMDVASSPAGRANKVVKCKVKSINIESLIFSFHNYTTYTVGVAQLVERWIVAPEVVGSSPITHPISS